MNKKKILVCGAGSIGLRHLKNIKALNHIAYSWRSRKSLQGELTKNYNILEFDDLSKAINKSDAVIIATAPDNHDCIIEKCIHAGKPIFIEKPISNNLSNLSNFSKQIKKYDIIVEVGCMLRFHPGIIYLKEVLGNNEFGKILCFSSYVGQDILQWRPNSDLKKSFSIKVESGGGVLAELIHEIDLVILFFGLVKKISCFTQNSYLKKIKLEESLANLILETNDNIQGIIQLDMLSQQYRREFHFICEKGLVIWDYLNGKVILKNNNSSEVLVSVSEDFDRNQMFLDHLKFFFNRIDNQIIKPACSFDDGKQALEIIFKARESANNNKHIFL